MEIKTELSVPVNKIKAKLLKLRSQLGREINKTSKTKSGQGTDELYKPTWVYWEKIQFLRPVMQPRKSRDSLQDILNPDVPSPASIQIPKMSTQVLRVKKSIRSQVQLDRVKSQWSLKDKNC